jgi:hypothetical protein
MRDIRFTCPHCNQHLEVAEDDMGITIPCPTCQGPITLPKLDQPILQVPTTPKPQASAPAVKTQPLPMLQAGQPQHIETPKLTPLPAAEGQKASCKIADHGNSSGALAFTGPKPYTVRKLANGTIERTYVPGFIKDLSPPTKGKEPAKQTTLQEQKMNIEMDFSLGVMYYNGKRLVNGRFYYNDDTFQPQSFVSQDHVKAANLFLKTAFQGHAMAQFNMAVMYTLGRGVPKDDAEAVKWYRMAADQGVARAQYSLGAMYHNGRGRPMDDTEAVKWYRKAAEKGYADAQLSLGWMYTHGKGVPQDNTEAERWYREATNAKANRWYRTGECLDGLHLNPWQPECEGPYKYKAGRRIFRPIFCLLWFILPFCLVGGLSLLYMISSILGFLLMGKIKRVKEEMTSFTDTLSEAWKDSCEKAEEHLNNFVFLGTFCWE